jgi:predicted transcriptional regulator
MSEAIALPKSRRSRLEKLTAKTGESPQKLARNAIAAHLDYLDWREKAICVGFESGEREGCKSSDEVFAAVTAQRARRAAK